MSLVQQALQQNNRNMLESDNQLAATEAA